MAGLVLNSKAFLRLNICAKLNICASISATSPSCKPLAVRLKQNNVKETFQLIHALKKMRNTLFPTLNTERLSLRQINQEDIHNIYFGLSNPDVIKYYGISFDTLKATEEQMIWFKNLEETETGIWWKICSKDNTIFYGAGGFNGLSKEHKKAEIGFWLLPEFWGKGFMQEAFPLICSYGFDHLKLNRIEGFVDNENQNCKRAIEKMNFKLEGTMRECEFKNGKYLNVDIYSKLKGD